MTTRTTMHETIVAERSFEAAVERVFAAFADPRERALWDVPDDDWEITEFVHDFRVGGREASRFGSKGDARFASEGMFLNIEPNVRIISAGTMHERGVPMTCTLCTYELYPERLGTLLVVTDQSAYFGAERAKQRRGGWGSVLGKLAQHLAGKKA